MENYKTKNNISPKHLYYVIRKMNRPFHGKGKISGIRYLWENRMTHLHNRKLIRNEKMLLKFKSTEWQGSQITSEPVAGLVNKLLVHN